MRPRGVDSERRAQGTVCHPRHLSQGVLTQLVHCEQILIVCQISPLVDISMRARARYPITLTSWELSRTPSGATWRRCGLGTLRATDAAELLTSTRELIEKLKRFSPQNGPNNTHKPPRTLRRNFSAYSRAEFLLLSERWVDNQLTCTAPLGSATAAPIIGGRSIRSHLPLARYQCFAPFLFPAWSAPGSPPRFPCLWASSLQLLQLRRSRPSPARPKPWPPSPRPSSRP